ncbi:uncharacterized protein LOC118433138 [Folsomia candida]|uniref:Uncharacterized protein n=1 Tax=Folsomia candida TaxID=158441 RepID=A0A226D1A5_FOLCA|nr:uncharacterized protein LOC118433138 [Folsomia candida]OXA38840.1 hypothetical protein Fcan01_26491 [Folsomia candida]
MRRTTDWAPTKKKPRKKLTKFQSRLKAWEENGSKLRPNHLLVAVTGLNRAERLKTYATPLYVGRREYNKRQARRCKNFTGIKKERIMANYPVAKKDLVEQGCKDALEKTLRRRLSLMKQKIAKPTLVMITPHQELMLQAAGNMIPETKPSIYHYYSE